jgi:hypothetical protein
MTPPFQNLNRSGRLLAAAVHLDLVAQFVAGHAFNFQLETHAVRHGLEMRDLNGHVRAGGTVDIVIGKADGNVGIILGFGRCNNAERAEHQKDRQGKRDRSPHGNPPFILTDMSSSYTYYHEFICNAIARINILLMNERGNLAGTPVYFC